MQELNFFNTSDDRTQDKIFYESASMYELQESNNSNLQAVFFFF